MAYPLAPHLIELIEKELDFDDLVAMLAYKTVAMTRDTYEDMANDDFMAFHDMLTKEKLEAGAIDNLFVSFPEMSMDNESDFPEDFRARYVTEQGYMKALEVTLATHIRNYINDIEKLHTFSLKV